MTPEKLRAIVTRHAEDERTSDCALLLDLLRKVRDAVANADVCPACGGETEHAEDCPLLVLEEGL